MTQRDRHDVMRRLRTAPRRMLIGVLIMLISGVLGGMLLKAGSETVSVLQVVHDVAAGQPVHPDDVTVQQVPARLTGPWVAQLPTTDGQVWTHAMQRGDLVAQSDLAHVHSDSYALGLELTTAQLPAGIRVGDEVQAWLVQQDSPAARVLSDAVTVLAIVDGETSDRKTVTVGVPRSAVGQLLQAADQAAVHLVRRE